MNTTIVAFALLTGLLTGAFFRFLQIPIPAPPNAAGVMGIIGIYLGYKLVEQLNVGFNLLESLGF